MDYRSESISSDEVEIDIAEEGLPEVANIPLEALHGMIRELPTGYRTVFNLYVFEEKNHKEISQILNIKEATSASQLHRAKALLAKRINNYLSGDSYYER